MRRAPASGKLSPDGPLSWRNPCADGNTNFPHHNRHSSPRGVPITLRKICIFLLQNSERGGCINATSSFLFIVGEDTFYIRCQVRHYTEHICKKCFSEMRNKRYWLHYELNTHIRCQRVNFIPEPAKKSQDSLQMQTRQDIIYLQYMKKW